MGLELSAFEITFNARTTVKEQALTDSVTEFTPVQENGSRMEPADPQHGIYSLMASREKPSLGQA